MWFPKKKSFRIGWQLVLSCIAHLYSPWPRFNKRFCSRHLCRPVILPLAHTIPIRQRDKSFLYNPRDTNNSSTKQQYHMVGMNYRGQTRRKLGISRHAVRFALDHPFPMSQCHPYVSIVVGGHSDGCKRAQLSGPPVEM